MDPGEGEKTDKKVDDVVVVLRRLSETAQARYTPRLKSYVSLQQKRQRASYARTRNERSHREKKASSKNADGQGEAKDKHENPVQPCHSQEGRKGKKSCEKCAPSKDRLSLRSRSGSDAEPCDRCGCRRKRRRKRSCRRRRRRRSCRRRRRRRRSCRRRRRRRRSCRRRRRRRSCRRKRRRRC